MKKLQGLSIYLKHEDFFDTFYVKKVEFEDTLENLHKLCNCSTIDIITRYINNRPYLFVIDDEGKLKEGWQNDIVARSVQNEEVLSGHILVVGLADELGDITSLEENDFNHILKSINNDDILVYDFCDRATYKA